MVDYDTAYIAGTRLGPPFDMGRDNFDWPRNVNIPLGRVETLPRYKVLQQYLQWYPEITKLVGHSMGGSVALVAAKNYNKHAETAGAPSISLPWQGGTRAKNRHRDVFDPVSMFDLGAKWSGGISKPHGYNWLDQL